MTTLKPASRSLAVGDKVQFTLGRHRLRGTLVEDRGRIGAAGRKLFRVRVEMLPGDTQVYELPEDDIHAIDQSQDLTRKEIIEYLAQGGLVSILRRNMAGGGNQPRVWLTRDSLGNVTYTFSREDGLLGGDTIPFFALHRSKIFRPKKTEVIRFLESFNLRPRDGELIVERIGLAP